MCDEAEARNEDWNDLTRIGHLPPTQAMLDKIPKKAHDN
jgi:hypothetical protein